MPASAPALQGHYGESRSKISLSYFPASQPTNIRFVDISVGNDEYCPTCLSLGDGKVRVIYEKGIAYGCYTSLCAEPVLYRSADHMETVEFFAAYPSPAEYEFVYRFLNGTIYAIYRTPPARNSLYYTTSPDMGKTWTEPVLLEDSVSCRPSMLTYGGHILMVYNYYNPDTENRPPIQQGRTTLRIRYGEAADPNQCHLVAELYRKGGMVNVGITEILGDIYLALEYQNGNAMVRGKDSIRYAKLGNLIPKLGTPAPGNFSAMLAVIDYVCRIGAKFCNTSDRKVLYREGIERIHLQERTLLQRLLEGTDSLPGLRYIPGVQVFADALPLTRRDLIVAMGITGIDVSDAVREYEKRGVIVCDRSNRSIYARRIVKALGITGAIRVSPLHCHGTEDIDKFLAVTQHLAQK